jgi:hypothetical protein
MELVRQIAISMDFDVEVFDGPDPKESLGKAVISRIQKSDCLIAILGPEGQSEELENHNESAQWPTQETILALGRNMPLIVIQHPDIKLPPLIESNQVPIRINFWDIKEREAKIHQVVEELYKLRQEFEKKTLTKNRQERLIIPIITGLLILIFAFNSILIHNSISLRKEENALAHNSISLRKKENALALMNFWSQNMTSDVRSKYYSFKKWLKSHRPTEEDKKKMKKWLDYIAQGIEEDKFKEEKEKKEGIPKTIYELCGLKGKNETDLIPTHLEEIRIALVRLLNTMEGIAISYQSDASDKAIIDKLFKESVAIYTINLKQFIDSYRTKQEHGNAWEPLRDLVLCGDWQKGSTQ